MTRLGVASLFGFVSIVRHLVHYSFIDATLRADLRSVMAEVTRVSHYTFDPASGQVEVGIFVTAEQLAAYPDAYFESAPARAYLARNPDFRSNGRYLAFAFEVDRANIDSLAQGAAESALGLGSGATAFGQRLSDGWVDPRFERPKTFFQRPIVRQSCAARPGNCGANGTSPIAPLVRTESRIAVLSTD